MAPRRLGRVGACLFLISAAYAATAWSAGATPAVTVGGPFSLMASDGTAVTDKTYRGKWLLVYFGYTSCPDTCPTALVEIASALVKLGAEAAYVQALFITVDPQRDTVELLRDYTRAFDGRIVGLTGSEQQIEAVASQYGAYLARRQTGSGDDYVVDHSSYIYVMNPAGGFVRAFDAAVTAQQMASTLHGLVVEQAQGQPGPE